MASIQRIELPDVLTWIGKPRYVLGTTFTLSLAFFESAIFRWIQRSNLRSCLIISDPIGYQRALTEGAALQSAGQDYMVVPAPVTGCFHPKVWVVIGEKEAVLLVGSGNLTQSGFITNAELFDAVHFSEETPGSIGLIESVRSFIRGLAALWPEADARHVLCVDVLRRIEEELALLPTKPDEKGEVQFLHSFAGRPLIEQMPALPKAKAIIVAAPFFGGDLRGVELVAKRYPSAKLKIFPAVHAESGTDIPLDRLMKAYPKSAVARLAPPGVAKGAFAHLKVYGIDGGDGNAWLFCTSANCTAAALGGTNVEAGLLRQVPVAKLEDYFVAAKEELPSGAISYQADADVSKLLHVWASDMGSYLEIGVAESGLSHLPLREVTLTIQAGSSLAMHRAEALFEKGRTARVDWNSFESWEKRRHMAVSLGVEGLSRSGSSLRGGCFVENRLLLTADPIHRSAWRGALALLNEDGVPEFADVAAIFSLVRDAFDGALTRPITSHAGAEKDTPEHEPESRAVAVWPPEPDLGELHRRIGPAGAGQVRWFQQILRTFLDREKLDSHTGATQTDDGEDEDTGAKVQERVLEDQSRMQTTVLRVWREALKEFEGLYDRLFRLEPKKENAANIWPAAVFSFLATMAVHQWASRMVPGVPLSPKAETICDEFIGLMLRERPQPSDFCCRKGDRYRREKFPSLVEDLRRTFQIAIHADLVVVMLAAITDAHLRSKTSGLPTAAGLGRARLVCADGFQVDQQSYRAALRVWRRYVASGDRTVPDDEFLRAFQELGVLGSAAISNENIS